MACFSPLTVLRTLIHEAQQRGALLPSAGAARIQFDALVLNEVSPALKHLASILRQQGLPSSACIALDHDPPYAELRIEEPFLQIFMVQTADFSQISVDMHTAGERHASKTTLVPMHALTGERLAFVLEETLIDTLLSPVPQM